VLEVMRPALEARVKTRADRDGDRRARLDLVRRTHLPTKERHRLVGERRRRRILGGAEIDFLVDADRVERVAHLRATVAVRVDGALPRLPLRTPDDPESERRHGAT